MGNAVAHFGQVAIVVFSLNKQALEWSRRFDSKAGLTERETHLQLHGKTALAYSSWSDKQRAAAFAEPAVFY
jgi:hypothetical protein